MLSKLLKYLEKLLLPKKKHDFTPEQIQRFKDACCWDENDKFMK